MSLRQVRAHKLPTDLSLPTLILLPVTLNIKRKGTVPFPSNYSSFSTLILRQCTDFDSDAKAEFPHKYIKTL